MCYADGSIYCKKEVMNLEKVQGKVAKRMERIGNLPCREKLKRLGFFSEMSKVTTADTLKDMAKAWIAAPWTQNCTIPAQEGTPKDTLGHREIPCQGRKQNLGYSL